MYEMYDIWYDSLRVCWVFSTESDRRSNESICGISDSLDHDATSNELIKAGSGYQIGEGTEEEENDKKF